MDNLKAASEYLVELGEQGSKPEVLEIAGKTYRTKRLSRCDMPKYAEPIKASTLSAMVDYITYRNNEFGKMMIHIVDPHTVNLISGLDQERQRECLFISQAITSEFTFDKWHDQERLMIELQSNFKPTEDLVVISKVAGNVESSTTANYGDDGKTQKTTIKNGIASKVDAIVQNPCRLIPYRTFIEVEQPISQFVFRVKEESGESPLFKLIEAEGGLWKNTAIRNIKNFFLRNLDPVLRRRIAIIG